MSASQDEKSRWNQVAIGNTSYNVERPPSHLAKIDLDSIKITPAFEKWPHKEQCACCKMYFSKASVTCKVPNHRIVDLKKSLNVVIKGQRYETASYLYASSSVCVTCAQFFDAVVSMGDVQDLASLGSSQSIGSLGSMGSVRSTESSRSRLRKEAAGARQKAFGDKLSITTELERANVALSTLDCRTYQSSIVDEMGAPNAVTVPYQGFSKTRREADPWWEVDFGGRDRNIHSISFYSNVTSKDGITLTVMLLRRPVGFENPFLDSVVSQAVQYKEFQLLPFEAGEWGAKYEWKVESCTCEAIRVQLRGIKPLVVREFKALLGDAFEPYDEKKAKKTIHMSLATLSPTRQSKSLHYMLSSQKKEVPMVGLVEDLAPAQFHGPDREALFAKTSDLDKKVRALYRAATQWKTKVQKISAKHFSEDEIKAWFYQLFCTSLLDVKKIQYDASFLTTGNMEAAGFPLLGGGVKEAKEEDEKEAKAEQEKERKTKETEELEAEMALLRETAKAGGDENGSVGDASTYSHMSKSVAPMEVPQEEKVDRYGMTIIDKLVDAPEPRLSLEVVHSKMRHILHTISSAGMHLKIPELIILSEHKVIAKLCDDLNATTESLNQLQHVFSYIEKEWEKADDRIDATEKLKQQRTLQAMMRKSGKVSISAEDIKANGGPKKAIKKSPRGCSWSQVLLILSLWVAKKPQQIPKVVFGLDLEAVHGSMWHVLHAYQKEEQLTARGAGGHGDFSAGDDGAFDDGMSTDSLRVVQKSRVAKGPPGDAPPPGFLDTRFSEYKLGNFKNRFLSEPEFPKTLDAKFSEESLFQKAKEEAAARNAAIWAAKIEEKRGKEEKKDHIKIIWPDEREKDVEDEAEAPNASMMPGVMGGGMSALMAATMPSGDDDAPRESGEFLGLPYVCALCTKRFPYNSTNCKVMYKHIITIRKSWDPKLVPKEIESLEQGTSMFNLSNICSFCAQFFNPDVDGGIEYPGREFPEEKKVHYKSNPKSETLISKFFDSKYDIRASPAEFLQRPSTSNYRRSAKSAIEVAERLVAEREAAEAYMQESLKKSEVVQYPNSEGED